MLRKTQLCFALAVVVPSLFTLAACGGGSGGATKITSISISPTTATVPVNTTSQFVATVKLSNSSTTTNTTVTWEVNAVYPVNFCSPGGLSAGPNGDLMVGCSLVFDQAGNACSAVVPSPSPNATVGHPALCTGTSGAQVAICNPSKGCTGNALVSVQGVGGGDELYYNSGDGNYYVTSGNLPIGPSFGVVASGLNTLQPNKLTQLVPTVPAVPAVLTGAGAHGAGTAHSIAAAGNFVYVPLPANTSYPNCATGCIAVFSAQ